MLIQRSIRKIASLSIVVRLVNIMFLIHDAVHSLLNYNQGEEIDSE